MKNVALVYPDDGVYNAVCRLIGESGSYLLEVAAPVHNWKQVLNVSYNPCLLLLSTDMDWELAKQIIVEIRHRFPGVYIISIEKRFPFDFLNQIISASVNGILLLNQVNERLLETMGSITDAQTLHNPWDYSSYSRQEDLYFENALDFQMIVERQDNNRIESFIKRNKIKRDSTVCVTEIWVRDERSRFYLESINQMLKHALDRLVNRFYVGYTFFSVQQHQLYRIACLFWYKDSNYYGLFTLDGIYQPLLNLINSELHNKAIMGISQYGSMDMLMDLKQQASQAGECYFWNQAKEILYFSNINRYISQAAGAYRAAVFEIAGIIRNSPNFTRDEALLQIDRMLECGRQVCLSRNLMIGYIRLYIENIMLKKIDDGKIPEPSVYGMIEKLQDMLTFKETGDYSKELIKALWVQSDGCGKSKQLARSAEKLILNHYSENLSLQDIADRLGVSPNHLGTVIKRYYQKSFNDLLTCTRMHEAKKLLYENRLTVKQIAQKVGIPNTSYFCTVFKKVTGMSPREFQQRNNLYNHD